MPAVVIVLLLSLLGACQSSSATPNRRLALVVGNSHYPSAPLSNATNDAFDMAQTLRDLGFEVIYKQDVTRDEFLTAISTFANRTNGNGGGLFYYSGHAFQLNGVNYLAPIDIGNVASSTVDQTAVRLERVFSALAQSGGANILLLDSCRNNPFGDPAAPGLARPQGMPTNTFISFSTAPNRVASDGVGMHSPYTRALLKFIKDPGTPIEEIFKEVRTIVETSTENQQTPWEESSLLAPYFFRAPVFMVAQFTGADDDAVLIVNGEDMTNWGNDHGNAKRVPLHGGKNPFVVRVFNQRSYTGGIPGLGGHLPEGWNYAISLHTDDGHTLASFSDGENQPADNGPRHGKWFTVVRGSIDVDASIDSIRLTEVDARAWTH
jgi:hypothetical protein